MVQVLIVDDHALVRKSVRALLEESSTLEVVGEARNGQEAIEIARQLEPDVIIMDISMPGMDGIAATRHVRSDTQHAEVVILTSSF